MGTDGTRRGYFPAGDFRCHGRAGTAHIRSRQSRPLWRIHSGGDVDSGIAVLGGGKVRMRAAELRYGNYRIL